MQIEQAGVHCQEIFSSNQPTDNQYRAVAAELFIRGPEGEKIITKLNTDMNFCSSVTAYILNSLTSIEIPQSYRWMSVNIPQTLVAQGVPEFLINYLKRSRIVAEITEGQGEPWSDQVYLQSIELAKLRIRLALDDFNPYIHDIYSSMAWLREVSKYSRPIVKINTQQYSIEQIARWVKIFQGVNNGLEFAEPRVVLEGIEQRSFYQSLYQEMTRLGVNLESVYNQGFLFQKPDPLTLQNL